MWRTGGGNAPSERDGGWLCSLICSPMASTRVLGFSKRRLPLWPERRSLRGLSFPADSLSAAPCLFAIPRPGAATATRIDAGIDIVDTSSGHLPAFQRISTSRKRAKSCFGSAGTQGNALRFGVRKERVMRPLSTLGSDIPFLRLASRPAAQSSCRIFHTGTGFSCTTCTVM